MKPDSVVALRRAGVLAEEVANELLAVAPAAPSSAQRVALDAVSYAMAAVSAIRGDLADIWQANHEEEEGK